MMNEEICTLETFANRLMKQVGIPGQYMVIYHRSTYSIEFDVRKVGGNHKYITSIQSTFRNITNKSSVGDRFKLNITTEYETWGNNIHVSIVVYPRLGEKAEDLVTVLRLEGLI